MKPIYGLAFLLLAPIAIAGCEKAQSQTPGQGPVKPPPAEVYYTLPQTREVTDFEDFTGHTDAFKIVQVRSRVSGYLVKINFEDGAVVKEGQTLFEIDDRPYVADFENKEALVAQTERHAQRLKSDFDRAQLMVSQNPKSMSQEQFDQYRFDYIEALSFMKAAKASRDLSQYNVDWTKVTAPFTGKISRRMVDVGNLVKADDTVLTNIVAEDPIYGYFDIDEHTLLRIRRLIEEGKLKKETESPVSLALMDETGFPHKGTINFVDNQLDGQTGTLRYRGTFENHDRLLSPGLFIRVRLPIGTPHPVLVIPDEAIQTDQGRKFVWVVSDKKVATYTPVEVGAPYPDRLRVIDKGLNPTDRVIVSGLQRVRSGSEVVPKELKPTDPPTNSNSSSTSTSAAPPTAPPEKPLIINSK